MIWLEELQTRKKISKIFNTYSATFSKDERRENEQFLALAENPNAFVFHIKNEDETVGYLILWKLLDCYFLEHFEIFQDFRNQKLGEKVLEFLKENYSKIILETELENQSEIAKRRVLFYKRNGFDIIKKDYFQPSYGEGKKSLNLYLMGNFQPKNIKNTIEKIYEIVYKKSLMSDKN